MTTGQDDARGTPPPVIDAGPPPNSLQRVIGVLFSPNQTFASIARRPDWVLPLVLILITSLGAGFVIAQHVDFGSATREAMEQNKNVSAEQIDKAVKMTNTFGKVFSYISPVIGTIFLLIIAGILLVVFRLFGGEGDFKQAFAVTCYASMPSIIKSIVTVIIIVARGGMVPAQALATIVRSNPGFLVDYKTNPMAFALLSSLDLFTIWYLALLIIGFAYVSRLSKAKSAMIIIGLWLLATCLKLIGPALQSLRANK